MTDLRDMWKHSRCLMCFLFRVHNSQPYKRLLSTTVLCTLIFVASLISCGSLQGDIVDHAIAWLCWFEALSPTLPRYLKWLTVFSWVASIFILGGVAVDPEAGWCTTSVLLRLIVRPNRWEVFCKMVYSSLKFMPQVCHESTIISKQSLHDGSVWSPSPCIQPSKVKYGANYSIPQEFSMGGVVQCMVQYACGEQVKKEMSKKNSATHQWW